MFAMSFYFIFLPLALYQIIIFSIPILSMQPQKAREQYWNHNGQTNREESEKGYLHENVTFFAYYAVRTLSSLWRKVNPSMPF